MPGSETRNPMPRIVSPFLVLTVALAGCTLFELPAAPGELLFQDDFSRPY